MYNYLSKFSSFLNPEISHFLFLNFLKLNFLRRIYDNKLLNVSLFGIDFPNPLGIAAGFDKNAESIEGILNLGFGFAEVGTVTPFSQEGNIKPRIFKIPECEAVIQRLGFNNKGVKFFINNLANYKKKKLNGIIGVNIGKNKNSENYFLDYLELLDKCSEFSDYIVVNISSPNTPGLRDIQKKEKINFFLKTLKQKNKRNTPLLLKISPDINNKDLENICHICSKENWLDGLIVSNTTISRNNMSSVKNSNIWKVRESGGLSGPPLFEKSNYVLKRVYKLTKGKIPIIGVGGISSAEDAFEKISLGANLIQIYTSLIYKGPTVIKDILEGLEKNLVLKGFKNLQSAVGHKVKI